MQVCGYELSDYTLNVLTKFYDCVGKNTCTGSLDWQTFEDGVPSDALHDGLSYFQMSAYCIGKVI